MLPSETQPKPKNISSFEELYTTSDEIREGYEFGIGMLGGTIGGAVVLFAGRTSLDMVTAASLGAGVAVWAGGRVVRRIRSSGK